MFVYCPISRHEDPHNVQVPFCSGPGITSSRSLLSNVLFLAIFLLLLFSLQGKDSNTVIIHNAMALQSLLVLKQYKSSCLCISLIYFIKCW